MLEYSTPESIRAEVEYRQARARELAQPLSAKESPTWLSRLFHRDDDRDQYDGKAHHRAA
ncbi:hypothetical protein [Kutzneria sp. NPDC052558]|uniref:hypothetical protein n=1 Tax=Kutzneria sp. NPDC052558 TaxID=3364121 RepID=UPI0037C8C1DF